MIKKTDCPACGGFSYEKPLVLFAVFRLKAFTAVRKMRRQGLLVNTEAGEIRVGCFGHTEVCECIRNPCEPPQVALSDLHHRRFDLEYNHLKRRKARRRRLKKLRR